MRYSRALKKKSRNIACVREVASAMVKGTSTSRASVRANSVLPEPEFFIWSRPESSFGEFGPKRVFCFIEFRLVSESARQQRLAGA